MAVVGDVEDVLLALEVVPVKIQRVERPVAVVGGQDDELRLRERSQIFARIDDRVERLALRGLRSSSANPSMCNRAICSE